MYSVGIGSRAFREACKRDAYTPPSSPSSSPESLKKLEAQRKANAFFLITPGACSEYARVASPEKQHIMYQVLSNGSSEELLKLHETMHTTIAKVRNVSPEAF